MNWRVRILQQRLGKPALAGALALLCAAEWLLPGPEAPPAPSFATSHAAAAAIASDATVSQWGNTVLARPLLSPARRPVPVASNIDDDSDYTLPRLTAIIITGGASRAAFSNPGQKPVLVAYGGMIGPYRVTAIAPDHVELLGPNGPTRLQPQFVAPAAGGAGP